MASISNIIKGLQIIEQYEPEALFEAGHDQIYCGEGGGAAMTDMTEEGLAIMESLGWFKDNQMGCWSRFA